MGTVLAGIVAVLLVSLLVAAVGAAGGWRRVRPATAADEASARPAAGAAGLDQRRWRVRTVADVLQLVLVVALGLTPLGARFVHLVAPTGDTWHDAAAWLLILAAVAAVTRLPVLWWQRQARRAKPELFRPRVELRATRAEELAADRGMISLAGDPAACADALGRLTSLLGTPAAWTLPQRLLFATHPATSERRRLLGDPAPVADIQPRAGLGDRVAHRLLAGVLVLVAAVAAIAVATASGSFDHRVIAVSAAMGKYRVVLPRHVGAAPVDTVSTDAAQLRSSVWGTGDISRFPGAAPVTAVYDEEDISWLYVWGAYGKLADPSGELSAFWNKYSFGMNVYPDVEPAGPLGGELQCDDGTMTCAWADNSAIVVSAWLLPAP